MGELQKIPGVGRQTEQDLIAIGYSTIASLRGANPEELYEQECIRQGVKVDRCVLYVYRCAVYYANTPPDERKPERLKWWNWKDKVME
ncbi:MAG: Pathogenicity locus [Peptococcaceae bacterium]|nr:Pathogenicity locus [Peptococcaceae bacterium]